MDCSQFAKPASLANMPNGSERHGLRASTDMNAYMGPLRRRNKPEATPWSDEIWAMARSPLVKQRGSRLRHDSIPPRELRPRSSNLSLASASTASSVPNKRTRKTSRTTTGRTDRQSYRRTEIQTDLAPRGFSTIAEPKPRAQNLRIAALRSPRPLSPSQTSIISTQTFMTDNSSSSNTTVTQESYNQSQKEEQQSIDVFQYLVQDNTEHTLHVMQEQKEIEQEGVVEQQEEHEQQDEGWGSDSSSSSSGPCDRSCCTTPDSDRRSVHSSGLWDSGISMGSESPELPMKARPAVTFREVSPSQSDTSGRKYAQHPARHQAPNAFNAPRYATSGSSSRAVYSPSGGRASALPSHEGRSFQGQPVEQAFDASPQRRLSGYELLAARLNDGDNASASPAPLYRKFDSLQRRTLLHLQDVIGELESELHVLDENIAPYMVDKFGKQCPQSRRQDKSYPGTIGFRRHQVLDMISYYLGQYNQLLGTQKESCNNDATPTAEHINGYKAWLKQNNAIAAPETAFLDRAPDLMLHKRTEQRAPALPSAHYILSIQFGVLVMILLSWLRT